MPYVSHFEEFAMEKGEARGRAEGLKEGIGLLLRRKFGQPGQDLMHELTHIADIERLRRVLESIEGALTIDEA